MKVAELIAELQRFPIEAEVVGTFEGVIRDITVYQAKSGTVMLDVDDCVYRDAFESGSRKADVPR